MGAPKGLLPVAAFGALTTSTRLPSQAENVGVFCDRKVSRQAFAGPPVRRRKGSSRGNYLPMFTVVWQMGCRNRLFPKLGGWSRKGAGRQAQARRQGGR